MQEYHRYFYDGPIFIFNTCVTEHWQGETVAPSENKARSNLAYQFKKSNNQCSTTKVTLPGKLTLIN